MGLGLRRIAVAIALGAAATSACAIDLSGYSEPLDSVDAAMVPDGTPVDVNVNEASADVTIDVPAPACLPSTTVTTTLTNDLGNWVKHGQNANGYPKVEKLFGQSCAVLFPFVDTTPMPIDAGPGADAGFNVAPEREEMSSGLWQPAPVALQSFDVSLEIYVRCTSSDSCADGVGIVWLDTTQSSLLDNSNNNNTGNTLGIPSSVSGTAIIADDYKNGPDESSDPNVPALEVVNIDGTKSIGNYPWIVASKDASFLSGWHTLTVSVRGTSLTVLYDGALTLSATVPSIKSGLFGIVSATGGSTDAVGVRNVKASFYDCVP
jgi:hypothetical protein